MILDRVETLDDNGRIAFVGSQDVTLVIEESDSVKELNFKEKDGEYFCERRTYLLNSASAPKVKVEKIDIGDITQEFFSVRTEKQDG